MLCSQNSGRRTTWFQTSSRRITWFETSGRRITWQVQQARVPSQAPNPSRGKSLFTTTSSKESPILKRYVLWTLVQSFIRINRCPSGILLTKRSKVSEEFYNKVNRLSIFLLSFSLQKTFNTFDDLLHGRALFSDEVKSKSLVPTFPNIFSRVN